MLFHVSLLHAIGSVAFPHKLSLSVYAAEVFACFSVPYAGTSAHQEHGCTVFYQSSAHLIFLAKLARAVPWGGTVCGS